MNPTPTPKQDIALEIAKTEIKTQLGINLQSLLQKGEDITFTKETINQDYAPLKQLGEIETKLKKMVNPWGQKWDDWNNAHKSLLNPVLELRKRKLEEFKAVHKQIEKELEDNKKENLRVQTHKENIQLKKLQFSGYIANAQNGRDLVRVQKLIGLERTRNYEEFLPELIAALDELTPEIEKQKGLLKQLDGLNTSLESEDEENVEELLNQKEQVQANIEESKINVQEKAATSAIQTNYTPVETTLQSVKEKRKLKKVEIVNQEIAIKKHPTVFDIIPNIAKLKLLLKEKESELETKGEIIENGIRYFIEKIY